MYKSVYILLHFLEFPVLTAHPRLAPMNFKQFLVLQKKKTLIEIK